MPKLYGRGVSAEMGELRCGRRRSKVENPPSLFPASAVFPLLVSHPLLPFPFLVVFPRFPLVFRFPSLGQLQHGIFLSSRLGSGDALVQSPCLADRETEARGGAELPCLCLDCVLPCWLAPRFSALKRFPFSGDLCWSCGTACIAQPRLDQGAHLPTVWFELFPLFCRLASLSSTKAQVHDLPCPLMCQ